METEDLEALIIATKSSKRSNSLERREGSRIYNLIGPCSIKARSLRIALRLANGVKDWVISERIIGLIMLGTASFIRGL